MQWTWGRGPLLNRQFPWHYPQPHTCVPLDPAEIWRRRRRLGIYVHSPFCAEKCDYCNYTVFAHRKQDSIGRYVSALKREIAMSARLPSLQDVVVTSLYFGGGSPSILENEWLEELIALLRGRFELAPDAEISIECNPIDVDDEKLATFHRMGVNRVSVGVQSFDTETLSSMRRAHSAELAAEAFTRIKQAGFRNVNLDLIYAYPTQTLESLAETVRWTVALQPERISCASLSVFPRTELFFKIQKGRLRPHTEAQEIEMFDLLLQSIPAAGYELSSLLSFSRPGIRFRQEEETLLEGVEMLGLGASAFSIVNGFVYANHAQLPSYYRCLEDERRLPLHRGRPIDVPTRMAMSVIQGLRFLVIDREAFRERFGVEIEQIFGDRLARLTESGLLERQERRYRLTYRGMLHSGPIMRELYAEPPVLHQTYQGEVVESAAETLVTLGQGAGSAAAEVAS
jgi:oxygen-independent coproporphyrinogen III oxidase